MFVPTVAFLRSIFGAPPPPPPPPPPATLWLEDFFVGVDGSNLSAHTMNIGPGWVYVGTWRIESDRAKSEGLDGNCVSDSGHANGSASIALTTPASGICDAGLSFNSDGAGNAWTFQPYTADNAFELYDPSFNLVASSAAAIASAHTYLLRVICNDDTITCFVDGAQVIQFVAVGRAQKSLTKHGLVAFPATDDNGTTFDNFAFYDSLS